MYSRELTPEEIQRRRERNTLKKYLSQAFRAKEMKRDLQIRLLNIMEECGSIGGHGYSGMPTSPSKSSDGAAAYSFRLADIEERIKSQGKVLEKSYENVMDIMDYLPIGDKGRAILEYRYIDFMTWDQVAKKVYLTVNPCIDHCNAALDKLLTFERIRTILEL